MPTSRRTFLKMMGIGAGALVAPSVVLGSSSTASAISVPSKGLAKHWVGYPGRELGCGFGVLSLQAQEYVVRPEFEKGTDPNEAFFKASLELQKILGEVTLQRLQEVPAIMRNRVEIVTSVFMPIHARSIDGPGFDVVADCAIEVKGYGFRDRSERDEVLNYGGGWNPPDGFEVYSTSGEYPIELPSKLDLRHLMSSASDWAQQDEGFLRRLSHIKVTHI